MSGQEQAPVAPTVLEMLIALAVLVDGVLAVGAGCWSADMQIDRDRARAVINRARAAGVL